MPYCEACGTALEEGAAACPSCGKSVEHSAGSDVEGLRWEARAPVISSRPVVTQLVLVFVIAGLAILGFVLLLDFESGLAAAPYILGIILFLIVLGLVIAAAIQVFSGGTPT